MFLKDFYNGNYSSYYVDRTFRQLAAQSNVAKLYLQGYDFFIINVEEYDGTNEGEHFHPSGVCGCLRSPGLGICTCELMWAEGFHEEYYIHDQYGNYYNNCLYIFGNHKGVLQTMLVVFCNSETKENDCNDYEKWYERPIDENGYIIKAIPMFIETKDDSYVDKRYAVINSNNGKIVDDANGYGYKTRIKALNAYNYKKANFLI